MKIKAIITIFFTSLVVFSSCNKQNSSEKKYSKLTGDYKTTIIGDTVSEINKKNLIIFQDENDHYWFGGNNKGVYKYNGSNFEKFDP